PCSATNRLRKSFNLVQRRDRHLRWPCGLRGSRLANGLGWPAGCPAAHHSRPAACATGRIHHDACAACACAATDCTSTRTPRPIVDDTATLRRYTPLLVAGLALFSASISATRLPCSFSGSKD